MPKLALVALALLLFSSPAFAAVKTYGPPQGRQNPPAFKGGLQDEGYRGYSGMRGYKGFTGDHPSKRSR